MNKYQTHPLSTLITVIALTTVLISGWVLLNQSSVNAGNTGKCTQSCPNGGSVSCEGEYTQSFYDKTDTGCICDGVKFSCSDKDKGKNANVNAAHTNAGNVNLNTNKNDKKKKKDKKHKNADTNDFVNENRT